MDLLNSKQEELLEEIVKPEKEGYIELYDSEGDKSRLLNDLIREGKQEIINKVILLKKTNLSYDKIKLLIKEKNLELLQELEDQHWWLSSEEEEKVESKTIHGKPSNFYKNYGFTLSLVDDCIKKETEDADRLLSLKRGFNKLEGEETLKGPGRGLDDNIMEEISKEISKKLRKARTKNKKKKKTKKIKKNKTKRRKKKKRRKNNKLQKGGVNYLYIHSDECGKSPTKTTDKDYQCLKIIGGELKPCSERICGGKLKEITIQDERGFITGWKCKKCEKIHGPGKSNCDEPLMLRFKIRCCDRAPGIQEIHNLW